jgi:hypothetical protein
MYQHDPAHTGWAKVTSQVPLGSINTLWTHKVNGIIQYGPIASDLNSDGQLEVILTTLGGNVVVLRGNGSLYWTFESHAVIVSSAAILTLENGKKGIAVVSSEGDVYLIDSDGRLQTTFKTGKEVLSTALSTADVDEDAKMEIVFDSIAIRLNGTILSLGAKTSASKGLASGYDLVADLRANGQNDSYPGRYPAVPALGDFNNDQDTDIVQFSTQNITRLTYRLTAMSWIKGILGSVDVTGFSCPPTTADLDGDGGSEIIIGMDDGSLRIIKIMAAKTVEFKPFGSRCVGAIPADLNNDGNLEVIAVYSEGAVAALGTNLDSDQDGLIDFWEDMRGTDKNNRDTDGDGLPDGIDEDPLVPKSNVVLAEGQKRSSQASYVAMLLSIVAAGLIIYILSTLLHRRYGPPVDKRAETGIKPEKSQVDDYFRSGKEN